MEGLNTLQQSRELINMKRMAIESEYNSILNNEKYIDALFTECKKINYNLQKIQLLSKLVDNINILDDKGKSLLYVVVTTGNLDIIKCLVENGINVNIQNTKSTEYHHNRPTGFALQEASEHHQLDIIEYLCEHGANVNLQNNDGDTALHFALLRSNNLEIVKYLCEHGANVNLQNNDGDTALHVALYHRGKNNLEVIKYLVEHNFDINLQNNTGNTILMVASLFGWLTVVKYLVEYGANIDIINKYGNTAYNIMDKHRDDVYHAVARGSDINMDVRLIGLYADEIKQYLDSLNN